MVLGGARCLELSPCNTDTPTSAGTRGTPLPGGQSSGIGGHAWTHFQPPWGDERVGTRAREWEDGRTLSVDLPAVMWGMIIPCVVWACKAETYSMQICHGLLPLQATGSFYCSSG